MLKLYRFSDVAKEYWETWEDGGDSHTVHWGMLGTEGATKTVASTATESAGARIQREIDALIVQGFAPVDDDDQAMLTIEYAIDGMGTPADLDKRHRLEDRMDATLGWTGLGACDGGSSGSGTMEVCTFVVDAGLARQVIEADLAGTEFSDYTRILVEDAR